MKFSSLVWAVETVWNYHVEDRDGVIWIIARGSAYMDASAVPELFTGSGTAYTTVQEDGYARWYTVSDGAAGKTMTVQVAKGRRLLGL